MRCAPPMPRKSSSSPASSLLPSSYLTHMLSVRPPVHAYVAGLVGRAGWEWDRRLASSQQSFIFNASRLIVRATPPFQGFPLKHQVEAAFLYISPYFVAFPTYFLWEPWRRRAYYLCVRTPSPSLSSRPASQPAQLPPH